MTPVSPTSSRPVDPRVRRTPSSTSSLEGWQDDDGLLLVLHYDAGLLSARAGRRLRRQVRAPARRGRGGTGRPGFPRSRCSPTRTAPPSTPRRKARPPRRTPATTSAAPSVLASFAATAARTPAAPAVTCGAETYRYADLRSLADRLTLGLVGTGVADTGLVGSDLAATGVADAGPGEVVGVCLPRSPAAIAAMLAVWSAGAAYLPLDPSYPDERLVALLAASAARAVITSGELARRLAGLRLSATLLVVPSDALPRRRHRKLRAGASGTSNPGSRRSGPG